MALRYLWAGSPCRRPVRRPSSPREDATEASVDGVPVPKLVVGGAWVVFQTETTLVRAGWLGESKGDGCSLDIFRKPPKKRKRLAIQS